MTRHLARRILDAFNSWRLARRLDKANPELSDLRRQIAECSRQHRNSAPLRRKLRAEVAARLAREQGRALPERIASCSAAAPSPSRLPFPAPAPPAGNRSSLENG